MRPEDEIEEIIENAIAELYRGFYRLRQSKQYQREYDTMGDILMMLQKDRRDIREMYKVMD